MSLGAFLREGLGAWWRDRHARPDELVALQQRRLRALVAHARARVPLYRELYADIDPADFDLARLPRVDKALLGERFSDSLADESISLEEAQQFAAASTGPGPLLRGRYLLTTTSGTTGRIGLFLTDSRFWSRQIGMLMARTLRERLIFRNVIRYGPWHRYRIAFVVATGGPYVSYLFSGYGNLGTALIARLRAFSIQAPLDELVSQLNRYRPHYLHGYSSFVEQLAFEQLAGRLQISPEIISLGSESVTPLRRRVLAEAFPATEIRETYGATECLAMANACRSGSLHINTDACVLEPVDADGQRVEPGVTSSRVLVTNLLNPVQPLIRYELNDQVQIQAEPCACGKPFPVLKVIGRTDDTLTLRRGDGSIASCPPIPFELLFLGIKGLQQYQLVHERQNALCVRFVAAPEVDLAALVPALEDAFAVWLREWRLEGEVEVRCEPLSALTRDPRSQKIRQIVTKVPALALPGAARGSA